MMNSRVGMCGICWSVGILTARGLDHAVDVVMADPAILDRHAVQIGTLDVTARQCP